MGSWANFVKIIIESIFESQEHQKEEQAKAKAKAKKPKPRICPKPLFTPHHRNLGLKPWASNDEIKTAWKRISVRLHPDKIRDPAQKEDAAAAMLLVNEAHDILFKQHRNHGQRYPWLYDWNKDPFINYPERARRKRDNRMEREVIKEHECKTAVARKPGLWVGKEGYKTYAQCETEDVYFCSEFWVDLGHEVFDNYLPLEYSDAIWNRDTGWRIPTNMTRGVQTRKNETLEFFGECLEHYKIVLPIPVQRAQEENWSHYHHTPCAETHLESRAADRWVALTISAMIGMLLLIVVVKCASIGWKGVELIVRPVWKATHVIERGILWIIGVAKRIFGWILYFFVWLLVWLCVALLLAYFLVPRDWIWE